MVLFFDIQFSTLRFQSNTVEQQIDIARQKGGISSWEKFSLERFEVVRHT